MIAQWMLPVLLAQLVVLAVNLWHWRRRREPAGNLATADLPRVSVLIPVRNERDRLPTLVQALRAQQVKPLEVILCDDNSDDSSREWLQANLPLHAPGEWLSWFPAPPKEADWVGKNWACYHLAGRAQGDWLVFLDADMELQEDTLHRFMQTLTLHARERSQPDDAPVYLVTAIPTLQASNLMVGLLKALLPFSIFTLLPLPLAERHPHRAFAFANGQVIAFPRDYYMRVQPHCRVRHAILEDVALARLVKSEGAQVRIIDGRRLFRVQMYRTLFEAIDGFSKNGVAICGSVPGAIAISLALAIVYLLPLVEGMARALTAWHGIAWAISVGLFALSAQMAGLPRWYGLLYPVGLILGEWTLWRSILWYTRGTVQWKGRTYSLRSGGQAR